MRSPKAFFEDQISIFSKEADSAHSQYQRWAWLRALFFIAGIATIIYFANARQFEALGLSLVVFIILFVVLIRQHQRIRLRRDYARIRVEINQTELNRLSGKLHNLDSGKEFVNQEHSYSYDLDVFGKNSLFQLLNHTNTPTGRRMLAKWLQNFASGKEIVERQAAVKELTPLVEERQTWQVLGQYSRKEESSLEPFFTWLEEPDQIQTSAIWKALRWVLPVATIGLYAAFGLGYISFGLASVGVVVNMLALGRWFQYSLKVAKYAEQSLAALNAYEGILKSIETFQPNSNRLKTLHAPLEVNGQKASVLMRQLQTTLDRFDSRANLVYILVNILLVLDIHGLIAAERWRARNKEAVRQWFDGVGEWEALSSLAGATYRHTDWTFPAVSQDKFRFEATALGHPLIPAGKRIANDFELAGAGTIAVVTGSNMAGKSTFLRTLGVNAVLAYAGAPVCAHSAQFSVMQIFTSMRTQDNLEESISSFFAELRRIRQLLERLKEDNTPVFFFLDEILKGTNSQDRHRGAAGLVKQLHQEQAMGLISTHDLELGALEKESVGVVNYSFNSKVEGEDIQFDYLLTEGVCQEFNAAALMAKMGIQVADTEH